MGQRPGDSCIWGHVESGNIYCFPNLQEADTSVPYKSSAGCSSLANGGSWMSPENNLTHFSATRSTEAGFRKPGTDILNLTISQDMNQKLQPIILDS